MGPAVVREHGGHADWAHDLSAVLKGFWGFETKGARIHRVPIGAPAICSMAFQYRMDIQL